MTRKQNWRGDNDYGIRSNNCNWLVSSFFVAVIVFVVHACACGCAYAWSSSASRSAMTVSRGRGGGWRTGSVGMVTKKESEADERIRHFFDSSVSGTAGMVVDAFLGREQRQRSDDDCDCNYDCDPLLVRTCSFHEKDGYDHLFASLFGSHDPNRSTSTTTSFGLIPKKQQSFKMTVAYRGSEFCGWQIQPNNSKLPSVQQTLVDRLNPLLLPQNNANEKKHKIKNVDVRVCGRTDAGVSALSQICRVRTLRKVSTNTNTNTNLDSDSNTDILCMEDIRRAINSPPRSSNSLVPAVPSLYCTNIEEVDNSFHPTFDAKCRAYVYLIDLDPFLSFLNYQLQLKLKLKLNSEDQVTVEQQTVLLLMNETLQRLENVQLDYLALSYGKVKTETTLCTLYRARASAVRYDHDHHGQSMNSICVELVGDRFLRRMVRILVATVLREVAEVLISELSEDDGLGGDVEMLVALARNRLWHIVQRGRREDSARAAPPDGLIFVGAEFH